MNAPPDIDLTDIPIADSWAVSVTDDLERSARRAWIVAICASFIAVILAIALILLIPLKTVEPYTLLVDRQTGHVEALAPLDTQVVSPDSALTRSMLVQYVIARESFDAAGLQDNFRKVSLMSDNAERQRYHALMQAENSQSPLSYLPRSGVIRAEIKSVTSLSDSRVLVRFVTRRSDQQGSAQLAQHWAAVVDYEFSGARMSEADRYVNPLGFLVTRYRRDAETLPEEGIFNGVRQGADRNGNP